MFTDTGAVSVAELYSPPSHPITRVGSGHSSNLPINGFTAACSYEH